MGVSEGRRGLGGRREGRRRVRGRKRVREVKDREPNEWSDKSYSEILRLRLKELQFMQDGES